jgi:hypothetical protein
MINVMNREIEFRGFDGTEWYYGDLEYNRKTDVARIHTYKEDGSYNRQYTVDPDTVGQFTGLVDKNGVKIFDGDIVKCETFVYKVAYNDKRIASFFLHRDVDMYRHYFGKAMDSDDCEVIGNIYDNTELLSTK